MAPTVKFKSGNKRIAKVNEGRHNKDVRDSDKNKPRKRKLSDMLGPLWSKDELECFYEAYRKYGKDWRKVTGKIMNRSSEMVEALYNMNKAYLSLSEGTATAAGLVAMMSDHYDYMEVSDSWCESNDATIKSRRPQKHARGIYPLMSKASDGPCPDIQQYQSTSSSYACVSLLKELSRGSQPRAVGKRTPRTPIDDIYGKGDSDKAVLSSKPGSQCEVSTATDEVAYAAERTLAEASQKEGSPQVSRTPCRRKEHLIISPIHSGERKDAESEMSDSKYQKTEENEIDHFSDERDPCGSTEEGLNVRKFKNKSEMDLKDDEPPAFDSLHMLTDLASDIPMSSFTVEPSVQVKEGKGKINYSKKSGLLESLPTSHLSDRPAAAERKDRSHFSVVEVDAVTPKSAEIPKDLAHDASASTELNQQIDTSTYKNPEISASQKSETEKMEFLSIKRLSSPSEARLSGLTGESLGDIDCMPLKTLENMPKALRRQHVGISTICNSFADIKQGKLEERKIGLSPRDADHPMSTLAKQAKAKAAGNEVAVAAQEATDNQPCTLAQILAREADIKALYELGSALDKKKALLIELAHMHDEASKNRNNGANFRKYYAMVCQEVKNATEQCSYAWNNLKKRNTYTGNSTPPWNRPSSGRPATHHGSFNPALVTQDSDYSVREIVQSSRQKARTMVYMAVQATRGRREEKDANVRTWEALDLTNKTSGIKPIPSKQTHDHSAHQVRTRKMKATSSHLHGPKSNISNDGNEAQFPLEMISNCVSALLMLQNRAKRPYAPAEVGQVLDTALTSLRPRCPQNLPVYREIEECMRIIKLQMLALYPTPSAEASTCKK